MKIIEKRRLPNGRKEIYLFGFKVLAYWSNKLRRIKRNCEIPIRYAKKLQREKNVQFVHQIGIMISENSEIGENCRIFHNVTLGGWRSKKTGKHSYPSLGKNVTIYCNSVLMGDIFVGDNSVIGAGSIVTCDIPPNEVWAGNPARFIKKREDLIDGFLE